MKPREKDPAIWTAAYAAAFVHLYARERNALDVPLGVDVSRRAMALDRVHGPEAVEIADAAVNAIHADEREGTEHAQAAGERQRAEGYRADLDAVAVIVDARPHDNIPARVQALARLLDVERARWRAPKLDVEAEIMRAFPDEINASPGTLRLRARDLCDRVLSADRARRAAPSLTADHAPTAPLTEAEARSWVHSMFPAPERWFYDGGGERLVNALLAASRGAIPAEVRPGKSAATPEQAVATGWCDQCPHREEATCADPACPKPALAHEDGDIRACRVCGRVAAEHPAPEYTIPSTCDGFEPAQDEPAERQRLRDEVEKATAGSPKNPAERLCVAVLATDRQGRVLLVHHRARAWELPGGKVQADEPPWCAAIREVQEEAGIWISVINTVPTEIQPRTLVYRAEAKGEPRHGGDAVDARWVTAAHVLTLRGEGHLSDVPSRDVLLAWAREHAAEVRTDGQTFVQATGAHTFGGRPRSDVDHTDTPRPPVLGGECARCLHQLPLHEPTCPTLRRQGAS